MAIFDARFKKTHYSLVLQHISYLVDTIRYLIDHQLLLGNAWKTFTKNNYPSFHLILRKQTY